MSVASLEQFLRLYFPKLYEQRKAEGRCMHCGARRPHDFKVSNTPPGTRQTQRTPGTPDPHNRKDRST